MVEDGTAINVIHVDFGFLTLMKEGYMDTVTFVIVIATCCFLMTFWAVVDVARKDFGSIEKKALWGFVAWLPFIGFVIYVIFGYGKGKKPSEIISGSETHNRGEKSP